jgi:tetratricopeptide (TPR) repeat protein
VIKTQKRDYTEAIRLFEKAISIESETAGYHFNLAITLNLQGKKEAALASYKKAIVLDPSLKGQIEDF